MISRGIVIDRIFEPGASRAAWSRALEAWRRSGEPGRPLKRDARTSVVAARLAGRDVIVKRWTLAGVSRLKASLGAGRGQRHWSGAAWLARHHVDTATCLVLAHDSSERERIDYLVMERLSGPSVLEILAAAGGRHDSTRGDAANAPQAALLGPRRQLALARELGRQLRRLIGHGRFNRDHKPSNLIVLSADHRPRVAIIDCVAILPVSRAGGPGEALQRMLASLYIEPSGVGAPPRRSLILATLHGALGIDRPASPGAPRTLRSHRVDRRRLRALWNSVADRVRSHGDPTPRVDPLAPPARAS